MMAAEIFINERLSIPADELEFRFSTSGGPGGQHANKSETQVTLLFDVAGSPSLDESSRARLLSRLAGRLDQNGILRLSVQDYRSQHQNRSLAIVRFQKLMAEALKVRKKRHKTCPSQAAIERRLEVKRRRSQRKEERRKTWD
jgi:ribosome-associated protein